MTRLRLGVLGGCLLLLAACQAAPKPEPKPWSPPVPTLEWEQVKRYPFPKTAFTQGLLIRSGKLWLSTGKYNESTIQEIDLASGEVLQQLDLPDTVFGEGLAMLGGKLYQLTWENRICYVYQPQPLKKTGTFTYEGQGWGLASNGEHLAMSDGTATIDFRDPETFKVRRSITVRDPQGEVSNLNELEFVGDKLLANVWTGNRVVVIDPADGKVLAQLDFAPLKKDALGDADDERRVLNGLAWDADKQLLLVTGKYWPWLYAVKVDWSALKAEPGSGDHARE